MIKKYKIILCTAISLLLLATVFYVYSLSNLFSLTTSSNSNVEGIPLPVLMYHGLIDSIAYQNQYFISPKTFERDLDYLEENGYTTVSMEELILYTIDPNASLPEKPILLSFDDGYYNNYLFAYPLLKERGMKATISIIGNMTEMFSNLDEDNKIYSHITWDQINEMLESGYIEIQNHTMDMHTYDKGRKGSTQKNSENLEDYKEILVDDVIFLQERITEMTGQTPTTFAYPFGFIGENSEALMKELGFKATLGCEKGINYITKNPSCLFKMKRILRPLNGPLSDFL